LRRLSSYLPWRRLRRYWCRRYRRNWLIGNAIDLWRRQSMRFVLLPHLIEAGLLILLGNACADICLRIMTGVFLPVLHDRRVVSAKFSGLAHMKL
jgi:hypothetical protein